MTLRVSVVGSVWIRKSCPTNLLFTCGHNYGYYFAPCQNVCAVAEWLKAKVTQIHGMMKTQVRIHPANFLPKTRFFKFQVLNRVGSTPDSSIPSHLVLVSKTDMNQGDISIILVNSFNILQLFLGSFFTHCPLNFSLYFLMEVFLRRGFHIRL